jgi:hypothetical protein
MKSNITGSGNGYGKIRVRISIKDKFQNYIIRENLAYKIFDLNIIKRKQ